MEKMEKELMAQELVDKACSRNHTAVCFYEVVADAKGVGDEYRRILSQPEFARLEGVFFQRMLDTKCTLIRQGRTDLLDGWE